MVPTVSLGLGKVGETIVAAEVVEPAGDLET
ncbi:MAG: hypothetical protein RLZZ387_5059, partial [Chloroflexota bacterium]